MRNLIKIWLCAAAMYMSASLAVEAQKIEFIKIPGLEKILNDPANKLFVINFWATWCPPCVAEMPDFVSAARDYDPAKVRFILVSLDFPSQVDKQLIPFLKNNNIRLKVDVMTDVDYNAWIDKVDKNWQGEIPATLFFNHTKQKRYFHSGELTGPELKKYIDSLL